MEYITGQYVGHACETEGGDYHRIVGEALVRKIISSSDEKRTGAQHDPEGTAWRIGHHFVIASRTDARRLAMHLGYLPIDGGSVGRDCHVPPFGLAATSIGTFLESRLVLKVSRFPST